MKLYSPCDSDLVMAYENQYHTLAANTDTDLPSAAGAYALQQFRHMGVRQIFEDQRAELVTGAPEVVRKEAEEAYTQYLQNEAAKAGVIVPQDGGPAVRGSGSSAELQASLAKRGLMPPGDPAPLPKPPTSAKPSKSKKSKPSSKKTATKKK